jgi:selenocysteine-specific translation elongation factor
LDAYDLPEIVHVFTKWDKNDLEYLEFQQTNIEHLFSEGAIEKYFSVSSLTGDGIDDLK